MRTFSCAMDVSSSIRLYIFPTRALLFPRLSLDCSSHTSVYSHPCLPPVANFDFSKSLMVCHRPRICSRRSWAVPYSSSRDTLLALCSQVSFSPRFFSPVPFRTVLYCHDPFGLAPLAWVFFRILPVLSGHESCASRRIALPTSRGPL